MNKIREILHPLTLASALIFFQMNFYLPNLTRQFSGLYYPILINAVLLGFAFGFLGCPGCSLPLSLTLTSHNEIRKTILPVTAFNLFRLAAIFIYAVLGSFGFSFLYKVSPRIMLALSGGIMIIFAVVILKGWAVKPPALLTALRSSNLVVLYAAWGFLLGFPCGFEATGFLAQLWAYPGSLFIRLVALFVFSLCAVLPITLFVYLFLLGIKGISRLLSTSRTFLKNLSFFYLSLMGILFIVTQIR